MLLNPPFINVLHSLVVASNGSRHSYYDHIQVTTLHLSTEWYISESKSTKVNWDLTHLKSIMKRTSLKSSGSVVEGSNTCQCWVEVYQMHIQNEWVSDQTSTNTYAKFTNAVVAETEVRQQTGDSTETYKYLSKLDWPKLQQKVRHK